jgi:GntR family transcriptional regulator
VDEAAPEECGKPATLTGAIPLCRPSKAKLVRAALPRGVELVTLPIRSATAWLGPWLPAPAGHLVGVASRWPEFLESARTMLIAAGLAGDTLVFRDARKPGWRRGLEQVTAILCDSYTATLPELPQRPFQIVYPLLADTAAELLRGYARSASE